MRPDASPAAEAAPLPVGVRIEDLSFSASGHTILSGISLDVAPGSSLSLVGASGSGKTSLLRCVAGLQKRSGGRVLHFGQSGEELDPRLVRTGFVFQDLGIFERSSARQNICLGEKRVLDNPFAEDVIAHLEIGHVLDRKVDNLSGGERQRIAIARALVRRPQILFMDEPFSSVDRALSSRLEIMLLQVRALFPFTLLYVTHNIRSAVRLSDRIGFMNAGRLEQVGSLETLEKHPASRAAVTFFSDPPPILVVKDHWSWEGCSPPPSLSGLFLRAADVEVCAEGAAVAGACLWTKARAVRVLERAAATTLLVELAGEPGKFVGATAQPGFEPAEGTLVQLHAPCQALLAV